MEKSTILAIFILLVSTLAFGTVDDGESIRQYFECDGAETEFLFTQPSNSSDDILVYKKVISTGAETLLVIDTNYEIAPTGGDYLDGGTVTIDPALASTFQVVIVREIKKSQETSQGAITPASVILSLDKLTRIVQDLEDRNDRSWHLLESDGTGFDMEIPALSLRASSFPFFDTDGNLTYVAGVSESSITTSTFGDSLIIAANAAAGATVLELGTLNDVVFAGITGTTGTFSEAIGAAATITLGTGANIVGAANSTIDFNAFDVLANGNTTIGGTLTVTGKATLGDTSVAVTQSAGDDSTQIATTEYVDAADVYSAYSTIGTVSLDIPLTETNDVAPTPVSVNTWVFVTVMHETTDEFRCTFAGYIGETSSPTILAAGTTLFSPSVAAGPDYTSYMIFVPATWYFRCTVHCLQSPAATWGSGGTRVYKTISIGN